MNKTLTDIFEVGSVLKTLVLCVLTIGLYLIYKLYRFSKQINKHTTLKIPNYFIVITVSLFSISLGSLINGVVNIHDLPISQSSICIHVVSSVFDVMWIIMVRNRINKISASNKGDILWLNPFLTSIFHVIYIQYKINQSAVKATL
ncbi:hypothetical protein J8L70_10930 [Pseudoalteromonas sp. MMG010]|uniref:hypothetical protein n=1 Tax=Pseudoalteromonas sp. MMG010 TaxID=2822685 RepID=UPI001B3A499A|nr:hypothetical protein [Pseudoalteromonas sp. MMG010]MBQ4833757.1 hypothetical protein [Pseudoalteromonas sp. MMG010]